MLKIWLSLVLGISIVFILFGNSNLVGSTEAANLNDTTASMPAKSNWIFNPWWGVFIAAISVLIATLVASSLVKIARKYIFHYNNRNSQTSTANNSLYEGEFWDIIRDGDYYPSLPRFQFLLWTIVISFAFLSIYIIRIDGGEYGFPNQIPNSVLQLMVISVAVPILGTPLSSYKYNTALSIKPISKSDLPPFSTMLLEADKPALFIPSNIIPLSYTS